jgi:hypothetical protein
MEDAVHHARYTPVNTISAEVYVRRNMKFSLGRIAWTRGVNELVAVDASFAKFVIYSLKRHSNCDWGELSADDKQENDFSLGNHLRLLSSYQHNDWKIWIITEADRSVTTILFPEEY